MKGVWTWLRVVLPPGWTFGFALGSYLLTEFLHWWTQRWLWGPGSWQFEPVEPIPLKVRDVLMLLTCGAYAAFRVTAFHPFYRPQYRRWLAQTPWTPDKPLPLGPIHIVPQDLLLIGLIRLLLHDMQVNETALLQAFLLTYVIFVVPALWGTGERLAAYLLVFGLGLALCLERWWPAASLLFLATCYGIAALSLRRSLRHFPWRTTLAPLARIWTNMQTRNLPERKVATDSEGFDLEPRDLGYPHDLMGPQLEPSVTSRFDRLALSCLAGWILYAIGTNFDPDAQPLSIMLAVGNTFCCIAGRLIHYCNNYWPPISFWGRLWTGRWFIPGYDKVFVAPLVTATVGLGGATVFMIGQFHSAWSLPGCCVLVGTTLAVTLLFGPPFERWRLTAPCRIGHVALPARFFEKI